MLHYPDISLREFGKRLFNSFRVNVGEKVKLKGTKILSEEPVKFGDDYHTCGRLNIYNDFVQYFRAPDDFLSGISLRFGTYLMKWPDQLFFRLHRIDDDFDVHSRATLLPAPFFETDVAAAGISNTGFFHLYFPSILESKGRLFALSLSSDGQEDDSGLTAWLTRSADQRIPGHVLCRATRVEIGSEFGLQAQLITSNPYAESAYPPGLLYSPLSSCNMNCVHCVSRESRRRVNRMTDGIRDEIRDRVQAGELKWIFTDYSGDIFFAERKKAGELDFLFGLGISVHIDTNGAYLDQNAIEKVLRSKVDALSISVDAATDETYQKIRIGAPPIDQIFDAARKLTDARKFLKRNDFNISMGYTLMRSNIDELPMFIEKAAAAGVDSVGCRHLEVYHSAMHAESLYMHKSRFNSVRARCIELAKQLKVNLMIGQELSDLTSVGGMGPCMIPWGSAVILANGDVMACCVPGSKMGNINDQTLKNIWNGEGYRRLRGRVNSANSPSLCATCQFRNTISGGSFDMQEKLHLNRSARPLLEDLMGVRPTVAL